MSDNPYRTPGSCAPSPFIGSLVTHDIRMPPGSQSLVIKRFNIEPGQKVNIRSRDLGWHIEPMFDACDLVYVGSRDIWILKESYAGGQPLFPGADIPCETFSPGCPTKISWPVFGCMGSSMDLDLLIENRGTEVGHFVARLAGNYVTRVC